MACTAKATTILLLLPALICSVHAGNGRGGCRLSDIQTRQRLTGKVEGKATFQVSIANQCSCPQAEVVVRCIGLYDSAVDKTKIRLLSGDLCSVANGEPIAWPSTVNFTYTQMTPVYFRAVSAKPRC